MALTSDWAPHEGTQPALSAQVNAIHLCNWRGWSQVPPLPMFHLKAGCHKGRNFTCWFFLLVFRIVGRNNMVSRCSSVTWKISVTLGGWLREWWAMRWTFICWSNYAPSGEPLSTSQQRAKDFNQEQIINCLIFYWSALQWVIVQVLQCTGSP